MAWLKELKRVLSLERKLDVVTLPKPIRIFGEWTWAIVFIEVLQVILI